MNLNDIANKIYYHQKEAVEMDKFSTQFPNLTLEDAYNIQMINTEKNLQAGDGFIGWKMGLTSKAKQQSVGVSQPILGRLLNSMKIQEGSLSLEGLIHPRIEPEFAFFINKKLEGNNVTAKEVMEATECIVPAAEVIDSRYRDFSFNLIDVVADNASSAKFLLSKKNFLPYQFEWEKMKVQMKLNDQVIKEGSGSAVLGHPVYSVVELVKMLHSFGRCVEPGMIVLTGAMTEAIQLNKGDIISAEFDQLDSIRLSVSE